MEGRGLAGLHATQPSVHPVMQHTRPDRMRLRWSIYSFYRQKQMQRDNQDLMGEKPVKNDAGHLSLDKKTKKEALRILW